MEQRIMTLFTRTPLHVGAGNSVGAVDAPIMRERHTRFPIIPGSSLKGVLRDLWCGDDAKPDCLWLFGNDQGEKEQANFRAGALLLGEARVVAFPVRSAKGSFAWVTCPVALGRYFRDAGMSDQAPKVTGESDCLAAAGVTFEKEKKVILEEYCLSVQTGAVAPVAEALRPLCSDPVWQEVATRLVVLSDEMFSYFVEHACEVVTRVRIDDERGTVAKGALFNQEQVPSETLFYAVIGAQAEKGKKDGPASARKDGKAALKALTDKLAANGSVLQVGGDETIGLGWCSVSWRTGKEA